MRRLVFLLPALFLLVAGAFAAAQPLSAPGFLPGRGGAMGQGQNVPTAANPLTSPLARDRAARADRQAQFNRPYSGLALRSGSVREDPAASPAGAR